MPRVQGRCIRQGGCVSALRIPDRTDRWGTEKRSDHRKDRQGMESGSGPGMASDLWRRPRLACRACDARFQPTTDWMVDNRRRHRLPHHEQGRCLVVPRMSNPHSAIHRGGAVRFPRWASWAIAGHMPTALMPRGLPGDCHGVGDQQLAHLDCAFEVPSEPR